jgi:hypothetical protein
MAAVVVARVAQETLPAQIAEVMVARVSHPQLLV